MTASKELDPRILGFRRLGAVFHLSIVNIINQIVRIGRQHQQAQNQNYFAGDQQDLNTTQNRQSIKVVVADEDPDGMIQQMINDIKPHHDKVSQIDMEVNGNFNQSYQVIFAHPDIYGWYKEYMPDQLQENLYDSDDMFTLRDYPVFFTEKLEERVICFFDFRAFAFVPVDPLLAQVTLFENYE